MFHYVCPAERIILFVVIYYYWSNSIDVYAVHRPTVTEMFQVMSDGDKLSKCWSPHTPMWRFKCLVHSHYWRVVIYFRSWLVPIHERRLGHWGMIFTLSVRSHPGTGLGVITKAGGTHCIWEWLDFSLAGIKTQQSVTALERITKACLSNPSPRNWQELPNKHSLSEQKAGEI